MPAAARAERRALPLYACHWQGIRRELKPEVILFLAGALGAITSAMVLLF
jgi:hypothetical protein